MQEIVVQAQPYELDGEPFEGQLLYVKGAQPRRALLMAPNFFGVSQSAIKMAHDLLTEDTVILILDPYGKGVHPQDAEQAMAAMSSLRDDYNKLRKRLEGGVQALAMVAEELGIGANNMAAFGFCFGGGCVLELARMGAPLKAFISFHGLLETPEPSSSETPKGPVLVLNGADDPMVSIDSRLAFEEEMAQVGADWQVVNFGGAVHSFTDPEANVPGRSQYHPVVARRAFAMMYDLLDEVFH